MTLSDNSYKAKMSKSYWVYDPENGACPGNCDPAYAMEQNVWRCGCGCWDIVSEAPRYLFPELEVGRPAPLGRRLHGQARRGEPEA